MNYSIIDSGKISLDSNWKSFTTVSKPPTSANNLYYCIVQQKPHKRTISYNGKKYFINIPFYTIFNIIHCQNNGLYHYPVKSDINTSLLTYSKVGSVNQPIESLNNDIKIYPFLYPHVGPTNMLICQYEFPSTNSLQEYVNSFISLFWNARNEFYMLNNFQSKKLNNLIINDNNELKLINKNLLLEVYFGHLSRKPSDRALIEDIYNKSGVYKTMEQFKDAASYKSD